MLAPAPPPTSTPPTRAPPEADNYPLRREDVVQMGISVRTGENPQIYDGTGLGGRRGTRRGASLACSLVFDRVFGSPSTRRSCHALDAFCGFGIARHLLL